MYSSSKNLYKLSDDAGVLTGGMAFAGEMEKKTYPVDKTIAEMKNSKKDESDQPQSTHKPVMLREVLESLAPAAGQIFVDGTFGGGGHTQGILATEARVVALDRDREEMKLSVSAIDQRCRARLITEHASFSKVADILCKHDIEVVDGILLDLGLSSVQLDNADRGFSFVHCGPLDMRMDRSSALTAADIVNKWSEGELADLFREMGEERWASRYARAIIEERVASEFLTTGQLAECIVRAFPMKWSRRHPATRIFQALRMEVNDELGELKNFLSIAEKCVKPGGVIAIITFHSLEDRIVKRFFRHGAQEYIDKPEWAEPRKNPNYRFYLPSRKPVLPSPDEVQQNPRARSAKLRVAKKI